MMSCRISIRFVMKTQEEEKTVWAFGKLSMSQRLTPMTLKIL